MTSPSRAEIEAVEERRRRGRGRRAPTPTDVRGRGPATVGRDPAVPSTARSRPSAAARRPSSGCASCPAPASSRSTAATLETYFPNKVHQQLVREPLVTVEKAERFDVIANLHGGGMSGQAGALRLAIARALIEIDADDRPALKKAGFLTRDARATERKKYGLKKARKAPQYSKR